MLKFQAAIKSKPQPNLTVKIQQPNNRPQHSFKCECNFCQSYTSNRIKLLLQNRSILIENKINKKLNNPDRQQYTRAFYWVLKNLLIPHNKIVTRGVDIFIPEICFYQNGQPLALFFNREAFDPHIKSLRKDKINTTLIQKLFSQRRKRYREKKDMITRRTISQKKSNCTNDDKKEKQFRTVLPKEAAIIRYMDGDQQLMHQNSFMNLLGKRKIDPIWKKMSILKNYLPFTGEGAKLYLAKYDVSNIKYENLRERAKLLMRVYGENIQQGEKNYISETDESQFNQKLISSNPLIYCQYVLYKIIEFIQYFHDQKIFKMSAQFMINADNQCFLIEVYKAQAKSLLKFDWTEEIYMKKIDQQQQKVFFSKQISIDQATQKKSHLIQLEMQRHYQKLKNQYGLSTVEQDNSQQLLSDQIYAKLHPEVKGNITDILKEKTMTVAKFKRVYLHAKPERKKLVRPYTSKMISKLQKLTQDSRRQLSSTIQLSTKRTKTTQPQSRARSFSVITPNRFSRTVQTFISS